MNIRRVTYFALGASVFAASCTKEAAEPDVYYWGDGKIYFKTTLAAVAPSRGQDMTLDNLESFQVTCFHTPDSDGRQEGYASNYFENAKFIRKPNLTYTSSPDEEPRNWPSDNGTMTFFAFSPALSELGGNAALEGTDTDYTLNSIRVNADISRQADFVTAVAKGERRKDFEAGVDLAFGHRLSQIELRAWGANPDYDFEIAGVRIGNPTAEGTYIFADDANKIEGEWETTANPVKNNVEYYYRAASATETADATAAGDIIYRINSAEHNTPESAASIMGLGGCAMVIPTENTRWEGLADPNIGNVPYTTDRMYFSILLRVAEPTTGSTLYPYPGNPYGMKVVSYAVDASGNILTRLYAGKTEGTYFTDAELQHPYVTTEGVEIKDFGWAAIPVDAYWNAGKRYIYTLNYSEGIGLHDPADPEPGTPIITKSPIEWGVEVSGWEYASPDENYTPDLNVPQ